MRKASTTRSIPALLFMLGMVLLATLMPQTAWAADDWTYPTGNIKNPFGGGKGTKDDPYIISTAQHLANLAHMVNYKDKDYDGEYFLMTRDIVLNDNVLDPSLTTSDYGIIRYSNNQAHFDNLKKWAPIGNYGYFWDSYFGGVFDGGGHTISGLYINEGFRNGKISNDRDENTYHGLFGLCKSARISNLTIKDSYMTTWDPGKEFTRYYGMLVGRENNTTITNCHVENCMIAGNPDDESGSMYAGGMVGYFDRGYMSGCSCNATMEVYQKKNIATTESESDYYPYVFAGGLVGYATNSNASASASENIITDCHTSGSLAVNAAEIDYGRGYDYMYAGGLVGFFDMYRNDLKIHTLARRCTNSMNIYAFYGDKDTEMTAYISGLANSTDRPTLASNSHSDTNGLIMEDCANFGDIHYGRFNPSAMTTSTSAKHYLAGLGCWIAFKRCVNYGDIRIAQFTNGDNTYVSGLLSEASSAKDTEDKLNACLNCGRIYYEFKGGTPHIDPIAAVNIGQSTVKNCYYNVMVNDDVDYLKSYVTDDANAKALDAPSMFKNINLARQLNLDLGSVLFGIIQDATSEYNGYVLPISLGASINEMNGKGTEDEPYLVYNTNDLQCMAAMTSSAEDMKGKVFRLAANIDLSGSETLPEIGSESNPFVSTFDGDGHYIRGMKGYQGAMFNYLGAGAEIKNLALLDAQPSSKGEFYGIANYVGGHDVTGASIHDCYVTADIDSEDHDLTMGGICNYLYTDNKVENCYFSGNVKMVNNSDAIARIAGIVHINFGTVINCHAVLSYQDAGTLKTRDHVGAFNNASGTQVNCYMALLLSGSKWDVEDKMTKGATVYDNEKDLRNATASFSDPWMRGLHHPVLRTAYHYTGDGNGETVGIDPDPIKRTPQENLIATVDPTADQTTDTRLWQMANVAVRSDVYKAYILSNFTIYPDAPIEYAEHTDYPLIGSAAYKLTAQRDDNWFSLCLPGIVKQRSLPDGAKLYVGGTLSNNRMNIVEVDSVPAGVPFLMYYKADEAGDFYITTASMSKLNTTPVKANEASSLQGTFKSDDSEAAQNNYCSKVTVGTDGKLYLTRAADNRVNGYTAYVDNTDGSGADVELTQYLLLDEKDNMTDKSVETNNGRSIGIKLMRNILPSGWNTLCLPFDVTTNELKERLGSLTKIEMLSNVTYDDASASVVLHFSSPTDDVIKAGTPFLLNPEHLGTLFDFSARTIVNEVHPTAFSDINIGSDGTANIALTGSFGKQLLASTDEENIYFVQGTKLYQAGRRNSVNMLGFRCWISATDATGTKAQALRSARLVHADGTATDIHLVDMGTADDGSRIYDLQGISHDTMQRGVNITRGKKVVRK